MYLKTKYMCHKLSQHLFVKYERTYKNKCSRPFQIAVSETFVSDSSFMKMKIRNSYYCQGPTKMSTFHIFKMKNFIWILVQMLKGCMVDERNTSESNALLTDQYLWEQHLELHLIFQIQWPNVTHTALHGNISHSYSQIGQYLNNRSCRFIAETMQGVSSRYI